jgi:hypothetical protein
MHMLLIIGNYISVTLKKKMERKACRSYEDKTKNLLQLNLNINLNLLISYSCLNSPMYESLQNV